MSQLKRRTAPLLKGLASAVSLAVIGLAPLPAHAQFPGYPSAGMAMPQAMLPPGFASGAPGYRAGLSGFGAAGARPMNMMPGLSPEMMMPRQPEWPSAMPQRSAWPAYGAGQFFDRSARGASPFTGPGEDATPRSSVPASALSRNGAAPGFYEDDAGREVNRRPRPTRAWEARGVISDRTVPPSVRPLRPVVGDLRGITSTQASPPAATYGNNPDSYLYAPQSPVTGTGGPALLGGFYYGSYSDSYYGPGTYPAVYSVYDGFPQYIYNPGVVYQSLGAAPTYLTAPVPFTPPQYTVTYNQNNYYVTNETKAADIEAGGEPAKQAVHQAYPADTYQAAFADIERAWTDGNLGLLKSHLRSDDTKISVSLSGKYKYSLNSSDFSQITRDAFDRLDTVSFQFTRLRKAKNDDVTAYGKHVYRVAGATAAHGGATLDNTVPFGDTTPSDDAGSSDSAPAGGEKTVYVSYTLHHGDDVWYIVSIDSSTDPLVK